MSHFDELEELCLQADLDFGAAECHGILSGLLCACSTLEQQQWLILLYDQEQINNLNADDLDRWHQLYQISSQQLSGDTLDFQLLLPDDELSLNLRTDSLADWCRGYIYGISAGKLELGSERSDNIKEIIHDLTQISNASYDENDADDNEGEHAFMELVEYIRAGVMLIYAENQAPNQSSGNAQTLH